MAANKTRKRKTSSAKKRTRTRQKDLKYAGNYRWQNGRGGYLFTIVTRPKLRVGLHGHYFDPNTGQQIGQYYIGGNSHPRVYDTTGTREWEHDPKTSMYKFVGKTNGEVYYSKPGYPGFNGTVATSDGVEQVIIRGQGCLLISAREFEKEIAAMEEHLRENYLNKTY